MKTKIYDILKDEFAGTVRHNSLEGEVAIKATGLSGDEAIGNPEDKDHPLVVWRQRMMQAEFRDSLD
jgi:hypothetical protein